jgi:ATPase subunit of ABC transporter with duplicated ATPase domains
VLVLDEPTNHLDIPSREALEEALDAYDGTIITISHDRYFLDRVATQILALDGEGHSEHYDGDYTEYHDWKAARRAAAAAAGREKAAESKPAPPPPAAAARDTGAARGSAKQRGGKDSKKQRSGGRDPQAIEDEIASAEKRLAALGEELASPDTARDPARLALLNEDYARAETRLRELYEEWERVAAEGASA